MKKYIIYLLLITFLSSCTLYNPFVAENFTNISANSSYVDKEPVPGNSGIFYSHSVTDTNIRFFWNKAVDDITPQNNLQYLLYYSSNDNIQNLNDVLLNGTPFGTFQTNIDSIFIDSLSSGSIYYFNIIVQDQQGKKSCYQSMQQNTYTYYSFGSDSFDDNIDDGWTKYNGTWSASSGFYELSTSGPGFKSIMDSSDSTDFSFYANVMITSALNDCGIIFRVANPGIGIDNFDGYYVGLNISSQQVLVGRMTAPNIYSERATYSMIILQNQWYYIGIVAEGSSIRVSINNNLIMIVDDAVYLAGKIGVRGRGTTARWDNILMY